MVKGNEINKNMIKEAMMRGSTQINVHYCYAVLKNFCSINIIFINMLPNCKTPNCFYEDYLHTFISGDFHVKCIDHR